MRVGEKESVVHPCISLLPPSLRLLLDTQSRSLLVIVVLHRLVLLLFHRASVFLACVMETKPLLIPSSNHCLVRKAGLGFGIVQLSEI